MIEAMACGTPVIAYRRGSVAEVVDDGVTGFIVRDEGDAVSAVARLDQLDRRQVRNVFERRFTVRRMAEDYLGHYRQISERLSETLPGGLQSPIIALPPPDANIQDITNIT
jgi:glycosyltransferase involved in cell wall biosynthesis